jgi:hypothetical protein
MIIIKFKQDWLIYLLNLRDEDGALKLSGHSPGPIFFGPKKDLSAASLEE